MGTWDNFSLPSQGSLGTTGNSSAAKKRRAAQAYQSPLADAFDSYRANSQKAEADAAAQKQQAAITAKATTDKNNAATKAKNDQIAKLTQQKQALLTPTKAPMLPAVTGGPSKINLTDGSLVANQKKAAALDAQIEAIKNPKKVVDDKQQLTLRGFSADTKDKTLFGKDVGKYMGQFGKITNIGSGKDVKTTAKGFLDQYDKLNDDAKKAYLNVLQTQANKKGDKAAAQTLATLHDNGRLKGNFNDFVSAANDKLYGGMIRGATNTADFVSGGKTKKATDKFLHETGNADDQNQQATTAGKVGAKVGNVESGIVQVGEIAIPTTAINKYVAATKYAKILEDASKGNKVAQAALKVAKAAPGAVAGGGITAEQDVATGNGKNLKKDAAVSVGLDLLGPGLGAGKEVVDKLTSKAASAAIKEGSSTGLKKVAQDGILSAADEAISKAGKTAVYKGSDLLNKTALGSAIIRGKDTFMNKFVDELSPAYKTMKRLEHEGKTDTPMYADLREKVGNYHRSGSAAGQFMDGNKNLQGAFKDIADKNPGNVIKGRKEFEDYANARSDKELHEGAGTTFESGGKTHTVEGKQFSDEKYAKDSATVKAGDAKYGTAYKKLTKYYDDLNDFQHDKGLITDETYQRNKDNPIDYIRQQRDLEDFQVDRPGGSGGGGMGGTGATTLAQKRNKFADGDLLPTFETLQARTQQLHRIHAGNEVKKTLADTLVAAGEGEVKKNTENVLARKALLNQLSEGKPVVNALNKTLRTENKNVRRLTSELNGLNRKGMELRTGRAAAKRDTSMPEFHPGGLGGDVPTSQAGRGGVRETKNFKMTDGERSLMESMGIKNNANKLGDSDTKAFLRNLVTADPSDIKAVRAMIERREPKLAALMDKVQGHAETLDAMHTERKAIYQKAVGLNQTVKKSSTPTLSYLDKGVENVVKVDPAIAHAVNGWDAESQNVLSSFLRASNNIFKYGTTGGNVAFALPNLVSDVAGIAVHTNALKETFAPSNFAETFLNVVGLSKSEASKAKLELYEAGNKGATTINQYKAARKASVAADKQMLENTSKISQLYTYVKNPAAAGRKLIDSVDDLVATTEQFGRQLSFNGTLNKSLKQGQSVADAARNANLASRENSVDFASAGTYGKVINQLVPYFNAAIQDTRQIARTASNRPATFLARTAAVVGVPVAATTIWNTEDKNRRAIYNEIPEYVKQANFVVVGPNAKYNDKTGKYDGVYIMKKPPGLSAFAEPTRKAIEKLNSGEPNSKLSDYLRGDALKDSVTAAANQSPVDVSSRHTAVNSLTPQLLKPSVEAVTNKDLYTGQDIVSKKYQDLPPEQQVRTDKDGTQHSSATSRFIGGHLPGGQASPLQVDHFLKATFGEVGTNIQNVADRAEVAATHDKNGKNDVGGRDLRESVTRRFAGAPGGNDSDAFYTSFKPAQSARTQITSQVKTLLADNQPAKAARIAEQYNSGLDARFKTFKSKFSDSPTYDPDWDDKIEKLKIDTSKYGQRKDKRLKYVYGKGYVSSGN